MNFDITEGFLKVILKGIKSCVLRRTSHVCMNDRSEEVGLSEGNKHAGCMRRWSPTTHHKKCENVAQITTIQTKVVTMKLLHNVIEVVMSGLVTGSLRYGERFGSF